MYASSVSTAGSEEESMNYFDRVRALTPTTFWVNNVTRAEAEEGLRCGALGCTQNPSYVWKMLTNDSEKDYAAGVLKECLSFSDDDNQVACELQRRLIKKVSDIFMPLWKRTHGRYGYVSIQGDPIHEENWEVILEEGRKNRELNPNIMIKIPVTSAGLKAARVLLREGTPINATEVMGIDQVIALGEMYKEVREECPAEPVLYFSLITGIYNEWLRKDVKEKEIEINPDVLHQAGMVIARKVYEVNNVRYGMGYISGGSRTLDDFYELVGGKISITMNWKGSCDELIKRDAPVIERISEPVPALVLDELNAKLPQFRKAYWIGGLKEEEFEDFGPVEYFRESFIRSWKSELEMIAKYRKR